MRERKFDNVKLNASTAAVLLLIESIICALHENGALDKRRVAEYIGNVLDDRLSSGEDERICALLEQCHVLLAPQEYRWLGILRGVVEGRKRDDLGEGD